MHHRDIAAEPSVACSRTAAWVWHGRHVPDSIDIIAKAHYRTLRYGRKINVFNRLAPSEHTIKVGPIIVTTPVRTACDLALNCVPETESKVSEIICMLMQEFHFRSNDCMQIMEDAKARNYILAIDRHDELAQRLRLTAETHADGHGESHRGIDADRANGP